MLEYESVWTRAQFRGSVFLSCPVLVLSPSVLSSCPLVCAVGRTRLQLSKRQVEQVQHSNPPSLSRTFPTPHVPRKERGRGTHRHTQRARGRKTETRWEATVGEEEKMLTFAVFQNETSHLSKHLQRIECPSERTLVSAEPRLAASGRL